MLGYSIAPTYVTLQHDHVFIIRCSIVILYVWLEHCVCLCYAGHYVYLCHAAALYLFMLRGNIVIIRFMQHHLYLFNAVVLCLFSVLALRSCMLFRMEHNI